MNKALLAISIAVGFAAIGCTPDKALEAANTGKTAPTAAPTATVTAAPSAAPPPAVAKVEFNENDFVESDRTRDPFRAFISVVSPQDTKKVVQKQVAVVLPQYSLDELKLVAIVTGGDYNRAMVIDPHGKGWVLKRGDFVGRPEIVHTGGANGADYQLNWRVDRVRAGDVVLVREDPAQPNLPPSTRVLALHPEGEPKLQLD